MGNKLSAALIGIAAAIALWSLHQARSSQDRVDALSAQMQDMREDDARDSRLSAATARLGSARTGNVESLARTTARHEALRALQEQARDSDGDPTDGAGNPPPAPAVTFEESVDRVHAAYAGEPVDSDWSPDASQHLTDVVRGNLPDGSRLQSLECRSTMCQLEVAHADPDAHAGFIMDGFRDWRGALFVAEEKPQDGEYVVTIFAAREGAELPLGPR